MNIGYRYVLLVNIYTYKLLSNIISKIDWISSYINSII